MRWQLYGGPVGEPALGPTAFPHRVSAMPSPLAIMHHWLDATHITYGVATSGIYGKRRKAEGSVFNGREPDENRTNFDFAAMDSYSGRLWFLPTTRWALQTRSTSMRGPPSCPASASRRCPAETRIDDVSPQAAHRKHLGKYGRVWNGLKPGVGGGLSAGIVPDSLKSLYGGRLNLGFGVFVTLRPAEAGM